MNDNEQNDVYWNFRAEQERRKLVLIHELNEEAAREGWSMLGLHSAIKAVLRQQV